MSWLHDRQPVILADQDALQTWLDTSSDNWTPALSNLCVPTSPSLEWSVRCLIRLPCADRAVTATKCPRK